MIATSTREPARIIEAHAYRVDPDLQDVCRYCGLPRRNRVHLGG